MKEIFILNKKEGETPLESLENFRKRNKKYQNIKMTYAGRLDPMASGALLVLAGSETKNKDKYISLDKEYKFDVLFGFSTDTYDILGMVTRSHILENTRVRDLEFEIKKHLKSFLGESNQKYPIYSSKTVFGKPLFKYAREGKKVDIPIRKVFIKKLVFKKIKKINNKNLYKNIEKRIKKVKGDFRQDQILKLWKKSLMTKEKKFFIIATFETKCSSGTYVRNIANSLGERVNIPALAFSIKRTKIC